MDIFYMKKMVKISEKNVKKVEKSIKFFDVAIISLMILASIYLILNYDKLMSSASAEIQYYGLWALFGFTFLFEFLPQVISPDYSLLLAIGLGINIYWVVIVTIVASAIGSWWAFIIGYHYGFRAIAPLFGEKQIDGVLRFWGKYGKWFVLAAGIIPLPIPYIPVIFGALRMRKRDFILWGIIPRAIGFIATGIVGYYWLNWLIGFF